MSRQIAEDGVEQVASTALCPESCLQLTANRRGDVDPGSQRPWRRERIAGADKDARGWPVPFAEDLDQGGLADPGLATHKRNLAAPRFSLLEKRCEPVEKRPPL
jgi:hypothetical protein